MFEHVVCGGTFDRLHDGHKVLLSKCFEVGKRVTIGITSSKMASQKLKSDNIQSYTVRKHAVEHYVREFTSPYSISKIEDMYGPTLSERSINAIVVSAETYSGAVSINKKRKEIGMRPLNIICVDMKVGTDQVHISSSRIRRGDINRHGEAYKKFLFGRNEFILPNTLISTLRIPLGRCFSSISEVLSTKHFKNTESASYYQDRMWITVGDVTTYECKKMGLTPTFSIIDAKTLRKALNPDYLAKIIEKDCLYALNKKGTISVDAIKTVYGNVELAHKKAAKQIYVHGEEDLLVLPVVLFLPLGSLVLYGQRDKGVICIEVTENAKRNVYNLIQKFL